MREVEVKALVVDPIHNTPLILLKDQSSDKVVPVWIGIPEAHAIAIEMQSKPFPRPLAHDLLKNVLKVLSGELDMIVIDSIHDGTYYATLFIKDKEGKLHEIDARPSDSIALALRTGSPIYIAEEVFEASAVEFPALEEEQQRNEFKRFVEQGMNLADFKKFIQQ